MSTQPTIAVIATCLRWALEYIDEITKDIELPAMTGFYRDYVDSVLASAQAQPSVTDERAAFEKFIAKDCGDQSTFGTGVNMHYKNSHVESAWIGWKRRAALTAQAAQPEWPSNGVYVGLAQRLITLSSRLGIACGDSVEHFNANLENNLYAICRGVESFLAAPSPQQAEGVPMCSDQAVMHALDMARTESHKQGDKALYLAFGRAIWLQFNAMLGAPQQAEPYPGHHDEIAKAICELSIAMGSPAVFGKRPASLLSETVRRAAFLLTQTPQQAEPLSDDTERVNWLETQGGITLERLNGTWTNAPAIYWQLEDRDGEYLNDEGEPTLREAIDAARGIKGAK